MNASSSLQLDFEALLREREPEVGETVFRTDITAHASPLASPTPRDSPPLPPSPSEKMNVPAKEVAGTEPPLSKRKKHIARKGQVKKQKKAVASDRENSSGGAEAATLRIGKINSLFDPEGRCKNVRYTSSYMNVPYILPGPSLLIKEDTRWETPEESFRAVKPLMLRGEASHFGKADTQTDQTAEILHYHLKAMNGTFFLGNRVSELEDDNTELYETLCQAQSDFRREKERAITLKSEREGLAQQRKIDKDIFDKALAELSLERDAAVGTISKADSQRKTAEEELAAVKKELERSKQRAILLEKAAIKAKDSVKVLVEQQVREFMRSPALTKHIQQAQSFILAELLSAHPDDSSLASIVSAFKTSKSLP